MASMILYFDPGRTRLFEGEDAFYDLSRLSDRTHAEFWCAANGVAFYDHRIELHPLWLRSRLLCARAAGAAELREKRPRCCPVTYGIKPAWVPEIAARPVARADSKPH